MSRSREPWPVECKVYVGGLPPEARSEELQDAFEKYGRLRKVWVARRPPGFAFVEFEDSRDADDAVRAMDGARLCGTRVRVEMSSGKRRNSGYRGGGDRGGGFGGGGRRRSRSPPRYRSRSRSRSRSPRRSPSRSPRRDTKRTSPSRSRSRSRSASR